MSRWEEVPGEGSLFLRALRELSLLRGRDLRSELSLRRALSDSGSGCCRGRLTCRWTPCVLRSTRGSCRGHIVLIVIIVLLLGRTSRGSTRLQWEQRLLIHLENSFVVTLGVDVALHVIIVAL